MLYLFCFTLLLLGQSLASPSANQYIDTVIYSALQNWIRSTKLDPTSLWNYTFEYIDMEGNYGKGGGKAEYTEGTLSGLSEVQRYSECQGPTNSTEGTVINCTLSFNNLVTSYKGKLKYGVLPEVTFKANGYVQNTLIDVEFVKPFKAKWPYNQGIQVNFRFRSEVSMLTDFTDLGPLNNHMKVLDKNYRSMVGSDVRTALGGRFLFVFEMAAEEVPMPLR